MFSQPITDPVLIFAIAMIIFLVAPLIMAKLRIPGIIGLIFSGVIIGPNGLGLLDRDPTIILLGTVGLLYIIFIAGLEIDLDGFKKYRSRSLVFGTLSFSIPFILGIIVTFYYGFSIGAAILLGSLLGSHTLLAYPIASRLGISKNKAVTTAVGGTIMTDTFALLILAIVAGSTQGELTPDFWFMLIVSLGLYVAGVFIIVPIVAKFFFRTLSSEGSLEYIFVMTVLFVSAYFATVAGLEPIIGAFLAGLALNRFILEQGTLMNRIKFIGNSIFIPFFLLSVGMLMDVRILLSDPSAWVMASIVVILVIIGKFLAAWIAGKIYHYSIEEIKLIFGLSIPQAAATLAATLVGYDLGFFDQATVNGVIVMILITCMIGPYTVEKFSRIIALKEAQKPYEPSTAPERVMVPIANPKTMESLMDLAFIIRGQSPQPLYTLSVAQGNREGSQARIVEAEKLLQHAVSYAAGAEVPIHMLTRIDSNITTGMIRAMDESRITTAVIGWNGKLSTPQKIFGGVLDKLLENSTQMIIVSKLGHPLNITKRIVILIPFGFDHKAGYYDSIQKVKQLANRLGAAIACYIIKDETISYEKDFQAIKPEAQVTMTRLESWNEWHQTYMPFLRQDDVIVVFSARRGTLAWHPQLESLPRILAQSGPKSFIIFYPPENEPVDSRGTRGTDVPKTFLSKKSYE
ncbi:cation:proton antiporter [Halalkalibacter nanhaiisediminis]|uniref:Transporter, CPA2 family (TC 2.A.37) n=1 Tax=Halalkalibacter nanhaiisediminis TaxID=688079 RepID=A0A562QAT6_9BACI|nr:cation:proton antiporter [Halalkalibacter nanhaiisediminis]TWI53280.1 transporter, CPA2 family (TC 2.A.37) [Halalkalibacter nanhaiisediminis]